MAIEIDVNGEIKVVNISGDMPLLWVLRDELRLTGSKFGCGMGQCGACTVHIDGVAQRSCILPISAISKQKITTIEGLKSKEAKAVQIAWQQLDVPQCGYCQSGQIMSAASLLTSNASPSDSDIDNAMSGNICRCATYARIRQAIHNAAESLEA